MRKTNTTNIELRKLISQLAKQKQKIFKRIAKDLSKPTRKRREVSIYRINKHTKDGESIIVPGKVLSPGNLDHSVNVYALNFSEKAKQKIIEKKGTANHLDKAIGQKGLRIIG